MKSIKYLALYISRGASRYFRSVLSVLLIVLVILLLLIKFQDNLFRNYLSEGVVGTYTENDLPATVTSLISQPLVSIDETGQPIPNLVENWQINEDSTVYTFKLKNNLHWSDGSVVKAGDIPISVEDAEITYPDDRTIQIKLSDSFAALPALLNKPIIKRGTTFGVGPYRVTQVELNNVFVKKITLVSADDNLKPLIVRFYPNEKIAINALKVGEVKSLVNISELGNFANQVPYKSISQTNYTRLVTIFYNTKDAVLSDKNFRLALSFSAPSIVNQTEAITSLSPKSWAFNPDVKDYLDNPQMAKSYFDKVKNGKDSTITLTVTSSLEAVGEQVVSAWNAQGIKAQLKVESGIPQNFQALLISQDIPQDPDQYSLWHSTQPITNISKLSSPRIDKDLEDGRKTPDLAARKVKYADFQKVLLDESPATFLYFPKSFTVFMKKDEADLSKILQKQFGS